MAGEADAPGAGLSELPERQREQAMTRWRLLAPHVEAGVPLARIAARSGGARADGAAVAARYRPGGLARLSRWMTRITRPTPPDGQPPGA
ncbi:MAG: hypothetical protein ACRDNF_13160, partial [Streptosporangiaceae bacterium]